MYTHGMAFFIIEKKKWKHVYFTVKVHIMKFAWLKAPITMLLFNVN